MKGMIFSWCVLEYYIQCGLLHTAVMQESSTAVHRLSLDSRISPLMLFYLKHLHLLYLHLTQSLSQIISIDRPQFAT